VLSLVLPTFNEAANVRSLIPQLTKVLEGLEYEIIVVDDDSPDKTWEVAEELAKAHSSVSVLRRVGRRGLSSAVTEGFGMAKGDVLMVMDGDGQHDPALVPMLYAAMQTGADIVVASRYTQGGSTGGWGGFRLWLSRFATSLASALPAVRTSDPMSGFFAVRADSYRRVEKKLHPMGFKILLEILRYLPSSSKLGEVPLTFGLRREGESKMSFKVQMEFLAQLASIALQRMAGGWGIFWAVCLALLLVLVIRIWPIRYLYLSSAVRSQTQAVLRQVSAEQGWLLSDIAVIQVRPGHLRVQYRPHIRGVDPTRCVQFALPPADPAPCSD
jgi:glycosyltransferase involved in cell wall biosynthesis